MTKEVQQYFKAVPAERKPLITRLRDLILELYPDAEELLWYKMPTYRAKSGWVSLANQKHYVSLYTCSETYIADFKAKHPQIKTGKACINFRDSDPVPAAALKKVIKLAMESKK